VLYNLHYVSIAQHLKKSGRIGERRGKRWMWYGWADFYRPPNRAADICPSRSKKPMQTITYLQAGTTEKPLTAGVSNWRAAFF